MSVKIAVLGSPHSGKSSLLHSHLFNAFSRFYARTGDSVLLAPDDPELTFFDLPGSLTTSNHLSYRLAEVVTIIVCFSLIERDTLADVETYWIPLAKHYNEDAKLLLVGCMKDMRPRNVPLCGPAVPFEMGRLAAGRIGAEYLECSALTEEGVGEVFSLALALALETVE